MDVKNFDDVGSCDCSLILHYNVTLQHRNSNSRIFGSSSGPGLASRLITCDNADPPFSAVPVRFVWRRPRSRVILYYIRNHPRIIISLYFPLFPTYFKCIVNTHTVGSVVYYTVGFFLKQNLENMFMCMFIYCIYRCMFII